MSKIPIDCIFVCEVFCIISLEDTICTIEEVVSKGLDEVGAC